MAKFWTYEEGIAAGLYDPGTSANSPILRDSWTIDDPPRPIVDPVGPQYAGGGVPLPRSRPDFGDEYQPGLTANQLPQVSRTSPFGMSSAVASPAAGGPIPNLQLGNSVIPSSATPTSGTNFWQSWFVRILIVVLGLIFVAAGLKQLAPNVVSVVK